MKPDTMRARERAQTLEQDARMLERLATANESLMQDKTRLETETVKLQKDVAALSAGIGAYRMLRDAERGQGTFTRALTQIDAWERASGHLAELEEAPQHVEPKAPALLDLLTLPVGTVCEAESFFHVYNSGVMVHVGDRFTIAGTLDGELPIRITLNGKQWWVAALQPARVVAQPEAAQKPESEPFRAGLPKLALRRVDVCWDARTASGVVCGDVRFSTYGQRWAYGSRKAADRLVFALDEPVLALEGEPLVACHFRPHGATWAEVEHKAARLLGRENRFAVMCCKLHDDIWIRDALGITDPTRDLTTLWAAFREGQKS